MCRFALFLAFTLIATFSAKLSAAEPASAPARPPNIIYLLADDLGYAELGCYGQQQIKTPNLDRMAAEGMRFTQHYSGNAVCATARCVLMTGKHTGHAYIRSNGNPPERKHDYAHGIFPGQHPIPADEVTIAELLQQRGYATGAAGKWGLGYEGSSGDPNKQGFDLFYGFICQIHAHNHYPRFLWRNGVQEKLPGNDRKLTGETFSQDKFTEVGLEFIRKNRQQPFFLYMPYSVPHLSIQVTEESLAQYRGKLPEEEYEHRSRYLKHPHPRAGYAAMISHLDRDIGKILALVKELGLDDNTLIMFSSDNGPTFRRLGGADSAFFKSAGPLRGLKGSLYEGGIRVPLIARWPGKIKPGSETDHPSAFYDVLPTACEVAGIDPPTTIDGISFLPTLLAKHQPQHDYLYWEFPGYGGQQAIRQGRYKAIRQNMLRKQNKDPLRIQLYDLETDIAEQHDLAAEHPELVKELANKMQAAHVPSKLFPIPAIDKLK